ncbi:MAG: DUF5367 family protein [Chloroflexi bacterium]|nr:DUF5367 family protein [Chloroflexota bacterium]MCY4245990.1 DUF5367 family protein [Chloroflexota bacterium]
MNRLFFAGVGFGVWLLATLAVRAAGQDFFLHDNPAVLAALWLLGGMSMIGLATLLFVRARLRRTQRFEAAVLLVLPGMALDAVVAQNFVSVFPNMNAAAAGSFGAWLLLCYASVLLAALLPVGEV